MAGKSKQLMAATAQATHADLGELRKAIGDLALEDERVGPDYIRDVHTHEEFRAALTEQIKALVPTLVKIDSFKVRGTTPDGKEIFAEFRTRGTERRPRGIYYKDGHYGERRRYSWEEEDEGPFLEDVIDRLFDVEPKQYKGSKERLKTLVHVGSLEGDSKKVEAAKKSIQALFP